MAHHEPEHRTTVVHTDRGSSGASWFIVGGIVVLALVGVWLFAGGAFDNSTTASIDTPDNVRVEVPDVDVDVVPTEPAAPQPAAPQTTAPAPAAPAPAQ